MVFRDQMEEQKFICKICDKVCLSGRSLGGHMRGHLHLIKTQKTAVKIQEKGKNPNKSLKIFYSNHGALADHSRKGYEEEEEEEEEENHVCKKCCKVFYSKRALYGHMKIHSKTPKKPSPIRYKFSANSPFYGLNEPKSIASELEQAAMCLMMLSRGVTIYCQKEISISDDIIYNDSCKNLPKIAALESGIFNGNEKNADSEVSVDGYDRIDQFKKPKRHENSVIQTEDSSQRRKKMFPFSQVNSSSEFSSSKDYECPVCFKVFACGKGLGGHKRIHYINAIENKKKRQTF